MWVFHYYFWLLCFCTGIASVFISASFFTSMRADITCFPGTALACLLDTSCHRIDSSSNLICINPKDLHTLCTLIGLQHPSETFFPLIHKAKVLLKNSSFGPDTAIDGPGPSSEYTGCPNIVDALVLMNLYTMNPLVFPKSLSTMMANDAYKLSMINASGGVYFPHFSLLYPG